MSQENVEVLRKVHAAYGRGDLEGFLTGWHPHGVYRAAITQAVEGETGDFQGHDGLRQWWQDLHDVYEDLDTEVLEVREVEGRVVVVFITRGRAKTSGIQAEELLAQVATLRAGKIIEARDYFTRKEALEAVGLSE
jgi:ketosteroid isomerase-like protein